MNTILLAVQSTAALDTQQVAEIVQIVLPLVLSLAAAFMTWYAKTYKDSKVNETDFYRLTGMAELLVRSAEEIGNREKWTPQQKLNHVRDALVLAFPQFDADFIDSAIHAAITVVGVGKSLANILRSA